MKKGGFEYFHSLVWPSSLPSLGKGRDEVLHTPDGRGIAETVPIEASPTVIQERVFELLGVGMD